MDVLQIKVNSISRKYTHGRWNEELLKEEGERCDISLQNMPTSHCLALSMYMYSVILPLLVPPLAQCCLLQCFLLRERKHLLQELHSKLIFECEPICKRLRYIPCKPGGPCRPGSPFSPLLPGSPSRPSRPGSPSRPSLPRGPWTVYILAVLIELPLVVLSCVDCTLLSSLGRAPAGWRREGILSVNTNNSCIEKLSAEVLTQHLSIIS